MNIIKNLSSKWKFDETPWNIFLPPLLLQSALGVSGITKCRKINFTASLVLIGYSCFVFMVFSYTAINATRVGVESNFRIFLVPMLLFRYSLHLTFLVIAIKNIYQTSDGNNFMDISNDTFSIYKELHTYRNFRLRRYLTLTILFTFWYLFNMGLSFYRGFEYFSDRWFDWDIQVVPSVCVIECEMLICCTLLLILSDCMEKVASILIPETENATVLIDKGSVEQLRSYPTTVERIGSLNDLVNISRASERYIRIFEIVDRLRDYFQLQESIDWSFNNALQLAVFLSRVLVTSILLCVSCQRIKWRVQNLKVALVGIAVRTKDRETRRRVRAVIRAITLQSTDITVYGVFQVDLGFLVTYAGLITTYMVVALQFYF